jgi:hypothetical protein
MIDDMDRHGDTIYGRMKLQNADFRFKCRNQSAICNLKSAISCL